MAMMVMVMIVMMMIMMEIMMITTWFHWTMKGEFVSQFNQCICINAVQRQFSKDERDGGINSSAL